MTDQASAPFQGTFQEPVYATEPIRWPSVDAFLSAPSKGDGIHVIACSSGHHIELLLGGSPYEVRDEPVLVVFSGAVMQRGERVPPFFSGAGIGRELERPYVAISDPGLALNETVAIGWYAGFAGFHVQSLLVELLRPLSAQLGEQLWLVGGSAGGFAALVAAHQLPGKCSVFVWNPQTDILHYHQNFVRNYLRAAFPLTDAVLREPDWKQRAAEVLREHRVWRNTNESLPTQGPARMLFIQNSTDFHWTDHCLPYLRQHRYVSRAPGIWSRDPNNVIWVGDFAEGHTPPPREVLVLLLRRFLGQRHDFLAAVQELDQLGFVPGNSEQRPGAAPLTADMVREQVDVWADGGSIHVASATMPERYSGLMWEAVVTDQQGTEIAKSGVQTAWGSWQVPAQAGGTAEVRVMDGFGQLLRQVRLPL